MVISLVERRKPFSLPLARPEAACDPLARFDTDVVMTWRTKIVVSRITTYRLPACCNTLLFKALLMHNLQLPKAQDRTVTMHNRGGADERKPDAHTQQEWPI